MKAWLRAKLDWLWVCCRRVGATLCAAAAWLAAKFDVQDRMIFGGLAIATVGGLLLQEPHAAPITLIALGVALVLLGRF